MEIQEQIKEWKDKYKYVYKINITDKDFYIRTLDRADYIDILGVQAKDVRAFDHDIEVCKKCIISEYEPDELFKKAGLSTVIAEKIMILSGFESSEAEEV